MSETKPPFGPPDIVRLSDEDASVQLLDHAIGGPWDVVNELTRFRRTTRENYRVTIFGSGIEETVALIRSNRDEWLRAQAAAKRSAPPEDT